MLSGPVVVLGLAQLTRAIDRTTAAAVVVVVAGMHFASSVGLDRAAQLQTSYPTLDRISRIDCSASLPLLRQSD